MKAEEITLLIPFWVNSTCEYFQEDEPIKEIEIKYKPNIMTTKDMNVIVPEKTDEKINE